MKFRTMLQGISFILLLLCVQNTALAQSWEFNTPADSEGWQAYNAGTINENTNVQDDGFFIIDPVGPDPWIENNGLSIDASSVDSIKIRMSSNCNDDIGAVYFSTEESPGYDENKKIGFTVSHGPEWFEYKISVSGNPHWVGVVTALRIDPTNHGNELPEIHDDTFGFDYIRLIGESGEIITSSEPEAPLSTIFTPDSNLNVKVTNVDATKFQGFFAYKNRQTMDPLASSIVLASNEHNINSIFLMALAAWEGGWGTSNYASTRHNWFGYGALYSNPDNAWEFLSDDECVDVIARRIKADYLLNSGKYSVLVPMGTIEGHPSYPYKIRSVDAGKYYNGPTVRGWIVKWNLNSQSEMDGIVSIMNDFASWHLQTYGKEIIIDDTQADGSSIINPPAPAQSAVYTNYYIEDPRIGDAIAWAEDAIEVKPYPYNKECLTFVQDAYDKETGANTVIKRYACAKDAADALNAAENNEGLPPRGTFVFYKWYGEAGGVYDHWGHVGLSIGNRKIIHNFGTSMKEQDYKSLDQTTFPYIGWAYPPLTPPINRRYPLSGNLYGSDEKDITGTFDSSTSEFTFGSKTVQFGLNTDIPVIGDWDKDGKDEIGVFRPIDDDGKSRFYLVTRDWKDLPYKVGDADNRIDFGSYPIDIPIAGDWDGDGDDDIGGFNPENNVFYLYELNLERSSAESFKDVPFGVTGDIPFIGDWNGDGKDELGVFRSPCPGNLHTNAFYFDLELTGGQHDLGVTGADGKLQPYEYGDIGDYPVIGDWDGNGDDDIGVFRPSDQEFYRDSKIPVNPDMSADITAIIHIYGSREGDDDYNPVLDVNSDGIINISDIVGALKDKIMDLLNLN